MTRRRGHKSKTKKVPGTPPSTLPASVPDPPADRSADLRTDQRQLATGPIPATTLLAPTDERDPEESEVPVAAFTLVSPAAEPEPDRQLPLWCPECASRHIASSRRRGIAETLMLWREGLAAYRCVRCDARFFRDRQHATPLRRPPGTGIDERTRRTWARSVITFFLAVAAVFMALWLIDYLTAPRPPLEGH